MKPDRIDTTIVLIDIGYKSSLNKFEEVFGENISYKEMEQRSYVSFKEEMFEKLNKDIKFRKFGRIGLILTIKAEMQLEEIEQFKTILEEDTISLITEWVVKEVTIIKKQNQNF